MDLRISGSDAIKGVMDKYNSSPTDYFSLKDDNDTAKVRFAHGDDNDLDVYVVHKVQLNSKDKYIACLSPANIPCPLCKAGLRATVRLFISLLDTRDQKIRIWDRGKSEIPNFLGLIGRYGKLDSRMYEIQRHGKKGDKETQYQFFPMDPLPADAAPITREPICSENGFVLQRTAAELEELLPQLSAPVANPAYAPQGAGAPAQRMF